MPALFVEITPGMGAAITRAFAGRNIQFVREFPNIGKFLGQFQTLTLVALYEAPRGTDIPPRTSLA